MIDSAVQGQPEAELVARVLAGETQHYDALVAAHRDAVFRLAYLVLGSADDAEDVAQETFIRALSQLHRFDQTRALRPWLLQITTRLARNRARTWQRYRKYVQQFFQLQPQREPGPEQQVQQEMQAERLWHVVQKLPDAQQEVIYLRYFLEMSVQETAEILSLPEGTVKSRQYRALEQLKRLIESSHPDLIEAFS